MCRNRVCKATWSYLKNSILITPIVALVLILMSANSLASNKWLNGSQATDVIGKSSGTATENKGISAIINTFDKYRGVVAKSIIDKELMGHVNTGGSSRQRCNFNKYNRDLLVTPFFIDLREQPSSFEVNRLGNLIGKTFKQELHNQIASLTIDFSQKQLLSLKRFNQKNAETIDALSRFVASRHGHQLALFGIISDQEGEYVLSVFLLDVYKKALLIEKHYPFSTTSVGNVHSHVATHEETETNGKFEQLIAKEIKRAVVDIDTKLTCTPPYSRIIASTDNGYLIDMGKSRGVTVGDVFLLEIERYADLPISHQSPFDTNIHTELLVQVVHENTALAVPIEETSSLNHLFQLVYPAQDLQTPKKELE